MSNKLYYIYIDTKILGAVKQLLSYFQSDVFNPNACISVYVKYYKENSEVISEMFDENGIRYKFIKKYTDISFEDGKVVFYLFNAQSNCRMVAFRNVSHVFITHGESNKKSSVKPITRIYDHVVTSGQVGIDRYLKAGLFTESDIENNRVIRLGSTFVGQNNYFYEKESRTLLYAPTWEGGVPDENFSSISKGIHKLLLKTIEDKGIKKLVIQTHPNLGHRDKNYKKSLKLLLSKFVKHKFSVLLVKNKISVKDKVQAFYCGFKYISSIKETSVSHAITDISAMEVQLLVKNIPTTVLANKEDYKDLVIPRKMNDYYSNTMVFLDKKDNNSICFYTSESIISYVESYQENSLKNLTLSKRVEWLCDYVNKEKLVQTKLRENI
ncbi:hypothetical protein [Psychrobacter okhotskensis]|uniref:hypothetical protein n=1 Tax=Psychrobacter okhotskensis TaxID=212403 RepID=UPI00191ADBA3|nr:hypothetical protein [Psychrobacter okhotskensis]